MEKPVVTDVRTTLFTGEGPAVAGGSFLLGGKVRINYNVIRRKDGGFFVRLPQRQGKKDGVTKWYSVVFVEDEAWRQQIDEVVLGKFAEATSANVNANSESVSNEESLADDMPHW